MNTCPHCGSSKLNGGFECGSMRVGEDVVQTRFCSYVTDFRKPIDAELQAAKSRIDAMQKAGDKLMEVMRGDEGIPYGDWIVKAWDAENAWRKAKEVKP